MGKLILWLLGLLVAIVTMNLTVYLGLTAVFIAVAGVRRLVRLVRPEDPDRLPRS